MITGSYSIQKDEQVTLRFKKNVNIIRRLEGNKTILEIEPNAV